MIKMLFKEIRKYIFFLHISAVHVRTGQGAYMDTTLLLKQNEIQMTSLWAKIGLTNDRKIPKDQDD